MLGMDLTEWRHLSGLADPYALALAEASAKAGVPASVQMTEDDTAFDLKKFAREKEHEDEPEGEREVVHVPKALRGKNATKTSSERLPMLKNRWAVFKAKQAHRKTFGVGAPKNEDVIWAEFLESRGSSMDEFGELLDLAIESGDEDLAAELLAVEDQIDELLGAVGAGLAKAGQAVGQGAMKVGGALARGAMAAGKGLAQGVGQVAQGAVKGFRAGMGAPGAAPVSGAAPSAGVGSPGGSPGSSANPPMATQSAPATAAAPAPAAQAAGGQQSTAAPAAAVAQPAPSMQKKQPGLLGTLGRGIGKVARGVVGMATAPARAIGQAAGQVAQGAQAGYRGEDVEAFEAYLNDEFGITAEQYIEMCDEAYSNNDEEAIQEMHQLDEIFAAWREKKAAEAKAKHERGMETVRQAVAGIKKAGGMEKSKAVARHGYGIPTAKVDKPVPKAGSGTTMNQSADSGDIALQIMESSGVLTPREREDNLKAVILQQLHFSGYNDEYINGKIDEKYMGFAAVKAAAAKSGARNPAAVAAAAGRQKYGKAKFQKAAAAGKKMKGMRPKQ